jgi:hypothetical protein
MSAAAATQVATRAPPKSKPAALRIAGFTKIMYDIVMKVTTPPKSSRRTVESLSLIWKNRSSIATHQTASIYQMKPHRANDFARGGPRP